MKLPPRGPVCLIASAARGTLGSRMSTVDSPRNIRASTRGRPARRRRRSRDRLAAGRLSAGRGEPHRARRDRRHADRRRDVPVEHLRLLQDRAGAWASRSPPASSRSAAFKCCIATRLARTAARRAREQRADHGRLGRGLHDRRRQHGGVRRAADGRRRVRPSDRADDRCGSRRSPRSACSPPFRSSAS